MKLDEVQSGIMNDAWSNWHYEFQMVEYEYNLQVEAYDKLNK